jgi:ribonuclease HI
MTKLTVYTDGACRGNPGPGGWAWAVAPGDVWSAGYDPATTNQRMEIMAVLRAYEQLPADVTIEIVSDSTYVVNCFRDRWWESWKRNGWKNSKKEPVANRDLWEPLIARYLERGRPALRWVKGHSGDPMNDLVDRLAVEAAAQRRDTSSPGVAQAAPAIAPDPPLSLF